MSAGGVGVASKILEVGCGTGNYISAIKSLLGCPCWGLDPSEQMLSVAGKQPKGVSLRLGNAEKIEFPADFFDLIFSVDVIHHVANCSRYFQEAHRVLKKGGKLCTVTDSEHLIRHRQPLSVYFPETVNVDLERYPRIADLTDDMGRHGFHTIRETAVQFAFCLGEIAAFRDKAFSCLHLISEEAFQRGLRRMRRFSHSECLAKRRVLFRFFHVHLFPGWTADAARRGISVHRCRG